MWGTASLYLPSEPYINTFHTLTHPYLVGRSMVFGHIPMVHTCSLMCTSHIDMTAHTPAFFLPSWVLLIYIWSTAQLGIASFHTFGAMPVGQSPIHILTGFMIAQLQWSSVRHPHHAMCYHLAITVGRCCAMNCVADVIATMIVAKWG